VEQFMEQSGISDEEAKQRLEDAVEQCRRRQG
jgi:energy-coupling factor transporter ATP-binding protein EcfA2